MTVRGPSTLPADLPALTALRFFLASAVAFFHYHLVWSWADMEVTSLIERGRLALDVFFILSGFILTHAYSRSLRQGTYRHGSFLIARLARIYPMHLSGLAVSAALLGAAYLLGAEPSRVGQSWTDFVRAVLMVQAWSADPTPIHWNGPSWSLSAEWFAYLLFPAFAWIGLKAQCRPWLLTGVAVGAFVLLDLLYQTLYGRILTRAEEGLGVLRIIPEFLLGIALYRLAERSPPSRMGAAVLLAGSFLTVLVLMHLGADDRLIVAASALLIFALAGSDRRRPAPTPPRWLVVAGEASFAFYLLHMPILLAWRGGMDVLVGRHGSEPMSMIEVMCLFGVTWVLALGAHFTWERPARDWLRRVSKPESSAPRSVAAFLPLRR